MTVQVAPILRWALFVLFTCFTTVGLAAQSEDSPLSAEEIADRLGIEGGVIVSTWDAGFPKTMVWSSDYIVADGDGGVALRLSTDPDSSERPYAGGEFQTDDYSAVWGRVEWQARLPEAPSGSVAAMFLYKTPYDVETLREFDFEYVPGDPKAGHPHGTMQMALHMKRHDGQGDRESSVYRIGMPERCITSVCGWAIDFQPDHIAFQIDLNQGDGWEVIGLFEHEEGWEMAAGENWGGSLLGTRQNFSDEDLWSEQKVKAFVSYWATDDRESWLGELDETELQPEAPRFVIQSMEAVAYDELSGFSEGDWLLTSNGAVHIVNIPEDELVATGIEYRVDGGEWRKLGAATPGVYGMDAAIPGQAVEIRSVARGPAFGDSKYEVLSGPSERKRVPSR